MVVLAKRRAERGATAWAQGGIVGVLGSDDSIESQCATRRMPAPVIVDDVGR